MIILIEGNETYLIDKKLNELTKDANNVIRLNGNDSDFTIEALLEACDTNSLFSETSKVLLNEPSFLVKKEKGEETKTVNTVLFEQYIDSPNYACDLIIYTYNNNFNKTSKIFKHLLSNAELISLNGLDPYNFAQGAKAIIKDYHLSFSNEAEEMFIRNCANSTTSLISYLDVLKNYPGKIDEKCIEALTSRALDNDVFDLINALANKKMSQAVSVLRKLYAANISVFMIISVLASQLRFLYQVDYYFSKNYRIDDIADLLKCKPYRIRKSKENLMALNRYSIIELLGKLSDIDILNKSDSSLTPEERFELYIVKNFRSNYEKD